MGVVRRLEQKIENLVNRPFARAFKAEVQPVEIASQLQHECDSNTAVLGRDRRMVPNEYVVELGEHDHSRLEPYEEALADELADILREHAEEQRYTFIGPVTVRLERHDDLGTGEFRTRSAAVAGAVAARPQPERPEPSLPSLEVSGARFTLTAPTTVIGRGTEADLRIDDPGISRRHAVVRRTGDQVSIADLGSTNGIVMDGRRVEAADLHDGDRLTLGKTTLVFREGERP